jgi:rhodanese-related sulfurtransferase
MKRRALSPFAITQLVMAVVIGGALWMAYWPWRWGQVRDEVRMRYPSVKRIDGPMLQKWLAERAVRPPLLLDMRTEAEFNVSHLPGARRVRLGLSLAENQLEGQESAQVVIYDTVGFDSAVFASTLLRRNFTDVQVLEGGIFQWANEGRPLAGPAGPTGKVAAGASPYANFLDRARRAP